MLRRLTQHLAVRLAGRRPHLRGLPVVIAELCPALLVVVPKVVPVLRPGPVYALVVHPARRLAAGPRRLWPRRGLEGRQVELGCGPAVVHVPEALDEDALVEGDGLDLVAVQPGPLDHRPQVGYDVPLLADDLVADGHLELKLLEADRLHPK
eukprot:scaffold651540_cov38-Prasinocladus_malaysianus.AAC.1